MNAVLIILAGVAGAVGVACAAAAAHSGGADAFGPASQMLLAHAPALLALGLYGRATGALSWPLRAGAIGLALGAGLFALALVMRHYVGQPPFPMAAPTGGVLMMAGWALVVGGAFVTSKAVPH